MWIFIHFAWSSPTRSSSCSTEAYWSSCSDPRCTGSTRTWIHLHGFSLPSILGWIFRIFLWTRPIYGLFRYFSIASPLPCSHFALRSNGWVHSTSLWLGFTVHCLSFMNWPGLYSLRIYASSLWKLHWIILQEELLYQCSYAGSMRLFFYSVSPLDLPQLIRNLYGSFALTR